MPYKPLAVDEAMPTRCECCEPSRQLLRSRTGPGELDELFYCPTTACSFKRIQTHDGRTVILRGLKTR